MAHLLVSSFLRSTFFCKPSNFKATPCVWVFLSSPATSSKEPMYLSQLCCYLSTLKNKSQQCPIRFDKLGLSSEPHCCLLGSHYFLQTDLYSSTFQWWIYDMVELMRVVHFAAFVLQITFFSQPSRLLLTWTQAVILFQSLGILVEASISKSNFLHSFCSA